MHLFPRLLSEQKNLNAHQVGMSLDENMALLSLNASVSYSQFSWLYLTLDMIVNSCEKFLCVRYFDKHFTDKKPEDFCP